jgi:hypothetical protein
VKHCCPHTTPPNGIRCRGLKVRTKDTNRSPQPGIFARGLPLGDCFYLSPRDGDSRVGSTAPPEPQQTPSPGGAAYHPFSRRSAGL